jgi:3-hydroxyisobutyrate dehydrogenase-like beta-hydroxyacid dehydrogenase
VIGTGNVGCALAADLGLRGVEVRLFNRSPGRLAALPASHLQERPPAESAPTSARPPPN